MRKGVEETHNVPSACRQNNEVAKHLSILVSACQKRETSLYIMPKGLSRHKKNKSFYKIT